MFIQNFPNEYKINSLLIYTERGKLKMPFYTSKSCKMQLGNNGLLKTFISKSKTNIYTKFQRTPNENQFHIYIYIC